MVVKKRVRKIQKLKISGIYSLADFYHVVFYRLVDLSVTEYVKFAKIERAKVLLEMHKPDRTGHFRCACFRHAQRFQLPFRYIRFTTQPALD